MKRAIYNVQYRIGAPWDGPPRPELARRALALPTGVRPARTNPGFRGIPIDGGEEWRVAGRNSG